jgi:hypothetical protein
MTTIAQRNSPVQEITDCVVGFVDVMGDGESGIIIDRDLHRLLGRLNEKFVDYGNHGINVPQLTRDVAMQVMKEHGFTRKPNTPYWGKGAYNVPPTHNPQQQVYGSQQQG